MLKIRIYRLILCHTCVAGAFLAPPQAPPAAPPQQQPAAAPQQPAAQPPQPAAAPQQPAVPPPAPAPGNAAGRNTTAGARAPGFGSRPLVTKRRVGRGRRPPGAPASYRSGAASRSRPSGSVSINSYGETRSLDARNLLEMILRINGYALVQEGEVYRVVKMLDAMHQPVPIQTARLATSRKTIRSCSI